MNKDSLKDKKFNNIAVAIHTCDKYYFILDEFFNLFEKYFPINYFDIFLSTETLEYKKPYITNIITGVGSWSDRFNKFLQTFQHQHFIYLQEDFLIQNVNTYLLDLAILVHQELNSKITKFGSSYDFSLYEYGSIENIPIYLQKDGNYIMSHQPVTLFEKQFFLDTIQNQHDCWSHELDVTKEISNGKYGNIQAYCIGNIYIPNKSDIVTIHHAIRKGQYVRLSDK